MRCFYFYEDYSSPFLHQHYSLHVSVAVLIYYVCLCVSLQECEQHSRLTKLKEEEMKRRHEIERKRLPKIQRDEIKAKSHQYRKSIRIDKRMSIDVEREMMKEVTNLSKIVQMKRN